MQDTLHTFLKRERIAVISLLLTDKTPHAATLHFSSQTQPLRIFFQTSTDTKKIKETQLMSGAKVPASIAIGFSEKDWLTLQLDGNIHAILDPEEKKHIQTIHYEKFPNAKEYADDPDTILLEFIPTWWRFSDYTTYPPKTLSSEEIDI